MKITIDGVRLDTDKAKLHIALYWADDRSNQHTGDVYLSSLDQWYVYTPSQWGNMHSWVLSTAAEILNDYDRYLTEEKKDAIARAGNLEWE
jgi:hypothetical protein